MNNIDEGASRSGARPIPSAAIISPTRNETANIDEFVKRTTAALDDCALDYEIVFADDSDDDTPEVIASLARAGAPVRCVHRPAGDRRDSISGAVRTALETVDADISVVIDADLQHPPEILPALIGPIAASVADFTIGTRYVDTGSAEGLRSPWRKFASRACGGFTLAMFPQYRHCSDLASGLFAFRTAEFIGGTGRPTGFKFLPEAMVRCNPDAIAEVPYVFEDRFDGLSKARIRDGWTLARSLVGLRIDSRRLRAASMVDNPRQYALDCVPPATDS